MNRWAIIGRPSGTANSAKRSCPPVTLSTPFRLRLEAGMLPNPQARMPTLRKLRRQGFPLKSLHRSKRLMMEETLVSSPSPRAFCGERVGERGISFLSVER